ncbi:hypothetical protein PQ465_06670 [Sphingobacterium oryzagri]|uniref:Lipid/polyisoprenoid-binding YceI-like domain-containing protein n=1 Tax=Sphingobacterium oryzagri TaxID=3025669 RepID=A0ABY7WKD3_9SPHI|nr:hypothetical protein [Sphingobacterium sp. KACC 22765]WDF70056.1 hypothetical protein PQ465_06670 [Sphingobacterium sp. KACC 22765]
MKIQSTLLALFILFLTSCSKETIAPEPTPEPAPVASAAVLSYFHENTAYYQPFVYRYDEETKTWGRRIGGHFSTISTDDPTYLGFTQPYVEDSGVNLFQMVTLYSTYTGTTNLKTAGINVSKVLQFFPDDESAMLVDAPTVRSKGTVNVFEQKVKIYKPGGETRADMEFIEIGISGEGTYNLETGVIDLTVYFNETAIGGAAKVARQYKISKTALTL